MKKLFGSLIALICVVACVLILPIEADAATSGDYTYWVSNGKAVISEMDTAISGDITIPSALGGYPVTGIGSEAFENCTGLTSVTIPDGVTYIGYRAFYGCSNLTSVIIPDSVADMSFEAFYGCTSLTSVTIPSSVTGIGDSSFYGCTSLTSVTIPDSVTNIDNYAFYDCSSLTSVTIPDGVTSIGSKAFYDCRSLTSVTIPNSVTNIGEDAFASCVRLQYSLYDNAKYLGNDANPYYALIRPTSTSIASCQIHSDTVVLSAYAFEDCTSLTSVTIPNSVTNIGESAFYGCTSLTSANIPDSVTNIGVDAFAACWGLNAVHISDISTWCSISFGNGFSNPLVYAMNLHLNGNLVTDLVIPDSVTKIEDSAFYGCTSLTSVTIPDGVTSIGDSAFRGCSNLTSIIIPDSVTGIGSDAFRGCSNLTSLTIPDNVTWIGGSAFAGCSGLIEITIPFVGERRKTASHTYQYPFGYLFGTSSYTGGTATTQYYYGASTSGNTVSSTYYIPTGLKSVTVTGGELLCGAFYYCSSLTSITIPDSITSIGDSAFRGCSNLTSITIPDSITSIGDSAFRGCSNLTSIIIPDSVTGIGAEAFRECRSLTSVTIPNSVTNIGESAFYGCTSLTSVTIPDGVNSIGNYTFLNCSSLTSVTIPDSVKNIGDYAFYRCTNLTSVTYCGTEEQWNQINIGSNNSALTNAERNYHNWQDATCTEPKTCILCGETTGEAIGHNWQDATCTVPKTCAACGSTDGDALEHSYVTEILEAPSFTAAGEQQKVCSVCGDTVTETLDMLVGEVSGWNVTLQDDLQVNFHLNISQSIESTARVRIVVGEEGYTFRVSGLEKTEDGLYIASVNIAAAQMTDFIFVTVINGSDLAETASYTVRGYADTILADEGFSEYHALVKEMLNYGAAAQLYFDYEEENLANEGVADAGSAEIPDSVDSELSVTGNAEGVTFYGASLIFRNKIAVRYYFQFKGDINDCSFTVNDTTYAPQLKDGLYYIEIKDILPQNLDEEIALMVTDANGNSLTVRYNPMNYIVRMNEKGSEALQNLVKALYNYHLAAKALQEIA